MAKVTVPIDRWQPTILTDVRQDMDVIKTSDPQHSFLLYKVDNPTCPTLKCVAAGECGAQMPLGGTPLSADDRNTIRTWVAQGAQND